MWQFKSLVGLFYRSQKASISLIIVLFFPMMTAVAIGSYGIASDYNSHRQAENSLVFLCNSAVNYHLSEGFINVEYFRDHEYLKDRNILDKLTANSNLENIEYNIYREGDKYVVSLKGYYDSFISRFVGSDSSSDQKYYNRECVLQQQTIRERRLFKTDFERARRCLKSKYSYLTMKQGSYFQRKCGPRNWHITLGLKVIYGTYGRARSGRIYAELDTLVPNPNNIKPFLSRNIYLNRGEYKMRFFYKGRSTSRLSNIISIYLEDLSGNTSRARLRKLLTVSGIHRRNSWNHITMKFKVIFSGDYKLKFAPEGREDGVGGIIDKIELFSLEVVPDLGVVLRDGTDTRDIQTPPATNENDAPSETPTTTENDAPSETPTTTTSKPPATNENTVTSKQPTNNENTVSK